MSGFLYLGADRNAETIATYKGYDKKASVYKRKGNFIDEIKFQFIPHNTAMLNSVQISADGSVIIFGTNQALVSFRQNNLSYIPFFNSTITNSVFYRTLSPDGLLLIYSETGTLNLRIMNNSDPTQLIKLSNLLPANVTYSTGVIQQIRVGQPEPRKYDIVCRVSLNNNYFMIYFQYDIATNTIWEPSVKPFVNPYPTQILYTGAYITQNGLYVAIMEKSSLRLYQKQSGNYVEVYNGTRVSSTAVVYFVAEDASLIVLKTGNNLRLNLLFKCDVQKCLKCKWINLCQVCDSGYVLDGNACVCPKGTFNLSGTCINCSITNCVACTASNVCSACGNGYSLTNNTCVCPSTRNISQTTQMCVACNVVNCYLCSSDDICEVFLPVVLNPTNATSNSTQSNQTVDSSAANNLSNGANLLSNAEETSESVERIESIVIVLAVVIGLMLVGMVMIALALAKLMKQAPNAASVRPEALHQETLSGQKNETSSIIKQQQCQNKPLEKMEMVQLPPDFAGQGQEDPQTEYIQPQTSPWSVTNLSMKNESLVKGKERKRRKLNQLNADYKKDVSNSQALRGVFPVSTNSAEIIDLE